MDRLLSPQRRAAWLAHVADLLAVRIPHGEVDPDSRRRIQLTTALTTLPTLLALPSVVRFGRLGVVASLALVVLAGAGSAANLLLLRRTHDPRIAGVLGTGQLFLLLLVGTLQAGGFLAPTFGWLYVVPLIAALTVDARAAGAFTVVVGLTTVAFWGLDAQARGVELTRLFDRLSAVLATGVVVGAVALRRSPLLSTTSDEELTEKVHFPPDVPSAPPSPARTDLDGLLPSRLRILSTGGRGDERWLESELAEHEVRVVSDPETAITTFLDEGYDVLLARLEAGPLSGIDLRTAIARLAPDRARRVLLTTSAPFSTDASIARRQGIAVLDEPLDGRELRSALARALAPG